MGRKNSPSAKKELTEIIQRYEAAKAEKTTTIPGWRPAR